VRLDASAQSLERRLAVELGRDPTTDEIAAEIGIDAGEALRDALKTLGHRDRRIIELRYRLGDEQPRTLEELARSFHITRERVRQIESGSLRTLDRILRKNQTVPRDIETPPERSPD
jgi:DNA-directed RNA polymerase sigma subunit (sigma70/sigma32)